MTDVRDIIKLCSTFREKGWFPGGLGAVAQLYQTSDDSYKVYVTPDSFGSNLALNDFFLLRSLGSLIDIREPLSRNTPMPPVISRWHEVFLHILSKPGVTSVAQIFLKWDALAARKALYTWKDGSNNHPNIFRIAHWDIVSRLIPELDSKELNLPIVEYNEATLEKVKMATDLYPSTCAILIRDYGMLLWGSSIENLVARAEVLEHLLELQIREHAIY